MNVADVQPYTLASNRFSAKLNRNGRGTLDALKNLDSRFGDDLVVRTSRRRRRSAYGARVTAYGSRHAIFLVRQAVNAGRLGLQQPKGTLGAGLRSSGVPSPVYETHWIGGAGDVTSFLGHGPTEITRWSASRYEDECPGTDMIWDHGALDAIVKHIVGNQVKVGHPVRPIIIGHSWGGVTAMAVARRLEDFGVKPYALVTLDPVARVNRLTESEAAGEPSLWVNVHQPQDYLDRLSDIPALGYLLSGVIGGVKLAAGSMAQDDFVATFGGQLGARQGAHVNIKTPLSHADMEDMMKLALNARPDIFAPGAVDVQEDSEDI